MGLRIEMLNDLVDPAVEMDANCQSRHIHVLIIVEFHSVSSLFST